MRGTRLCTIPINQTIKNDECLLIDYKIVLMKETEITMREKIEFADDILIIDELEDGETYHVTVPMLNVNKLTNDPATTLIHYVPTLTHIEAMEKQLEKMIEQEQQIQRRIVAISVKIGIMKEVNNGAKEIKKFEDKITAAIRLITADTSVYHRFWGEVRTVSVDKEGNVSFGPRAMNRERPGEEG